MSRVEIQARSSRLLRPPRSTTSSLRHGTRNVPALGDRWDSVTTSVYLAARRDPRHLVWYYRGESSREPGLIGHEFTGVVEGIGAEVDGIAKGALVIAPFAYSDGTCAQSAGGATRSGHGRGIDEDVALRPARSRSGEVARVLHSRRLRSGRERARNPVGGT